MNVVKAYVYKLKTNLIIEDRFKQIAGCCRFVYNLFLNQCIQEYGTDFVSVSYYDQATQLPVLKDEFPWLGKCPSQSLQHALKDLDMAFKHFFRRCRKGEKPGFPRYHKKSDKASFRYPQGVRVKDNRVYLPKVGWVRFFKSRDIVGIIKNTTIVRKADGWYVSFQTETTIPEPEHQSKTTVGIDRGVKHFAVCSDGTFIDFPDTYDKHHKKLKVEQRKLSRKKKFSGNWYKKKDKVSELHYKLANIRNDFLHKTSTTLSKNHAVVVLEDLKVKNMSKSAKGTTDSPGTKVKAKSGLNRMILKQGLYRFQAMLEYKQQYSGGAVLYVNPKNSSLKCSKCGHVSKNNRKSQSVFKCENCGHTENADYNASVNISMAVGHTVSACGVDPLGITVKQESPTL
ncbi:MAG: transposase [Actinomycetota bacterium]|nr:transposase [Actinomycetota bacterium]